MDTFTVIIPGDRDPGGRWTRGGTGLSDTGPGVHVVHTEARYWIFLQEGPSASHRDVSVLGRHVGDVIILEK